MMTIVGVIAKYELFIFLYLGKHKLGTVLERNRPEVKISAIRTGTRWILSVTTASVCDLGEEGLAATIAS